MPPPTPAANVRADLGDVTYDATLTHRIVVQVGGRLRHWPETPEAPPAPPRREDDPANIIYDFIPSTGAARRGHGSQRQIVDMASCNTCHSKLAFHGGNRVDTQFCVMCHNDQRKFGGPQPRWTPPRPPAITGTTYKIQTAWPPATCPP